MDSENQFWVRICQLGTAVVVVFILAISGCTYHSKEVVVRLVEAGADPIMARCAVYLDSQGGDILCASALTQR